MREPANDNYVMTFDEARQALKVNEHTVRGLLASGSLRGGKIGRQWRIRRDDLSAYLEALTCPSINAATCGSTTSPSTASVIDVRPARAPKRRRLGSKGGSATPPPWEVYLSGR